jgi:hypothetical protein
MDVRLSGPAVRRARGVETVWAVQKAGGALPAPCSWRSGRLTVLPPPVPAVASAPAVAPAPLLPPPPVPPPPLPPKAEAAARAVA